MIATLFGRMRFAALLVAALALVHLANQVYPGYDLRWLGVVPRDPASLWHIVTAPLLHQDWNHLLSNSLPLFVLTILALRQGPRRFWLASAVIVLVGGLMLWLVGRNGLHLGASGWVFGLWGLIIADGWYERSLAAIGTSLLVMILYGGMVWGLLPADGVSVESHIAGMIAGVLHSRWQHRSRTDGR